MTSKPVQVDLHVSGIQFPNLGGRGAMPTLIRGMVTGHGEHAKVEEGDGRNCAHVLVIPH